MLRRAPFLLAFATLLAGGTAGAQSTDPPADPEGGRARVFTVDNVLRPGPGRVPVAVEVARTPRIELGVGEDPPTRERRDGAFGVARAPSLCRTPCTLYLRPGFSRLVGDSMGDFPWAVDVRVPDAGPSTVRLRGHLLGFSALGGVGFILGLAGAVIGPAAIIISAIVGEPRLPVPLVVGGSIAAVVGGALIWGGYGLIRYAAPRVETPAGAAPQRRARARWMLAPVPTREGADVTAVVAF